MNVLFLSTHLNVGGIASYLFVLAQGLVRRGDQVFVGAGGGDREDEFRTAGVRVVPLAIRTKSELDPRLYLALPRLCRLIRSTPIHVVHTHTRVTQVMGQILSAVTGCRHVTTCHGFFKPKWSRLAFPCWGSRVIAISPAVAAHLQKDLRVAPENIVTVRNGIDETLFPLITAPMRQRRREELGILPEKIVLGIIARLSDVKGHAVLIEALPGILEKFPHAILLIVGGGPLEGDLKRIVGERGLQEKIFFYPVVNRTVDFLAAFDLFIMPSLQEGLGISVMEAQACGLPVVASRVGGIPGLIEEGKTGWLVDPADSKALAHVIKEVLAQPQAAQDAGLRARAFILKEYSAERMIQETRQIYANLLNV